MILLKSYEVVEDKRKLMDKEKIGIYVHIPFCKKKCKYCDFVSFENKENTICEKYVDKLTQEIEYVFEKDSKKYNEIGYSFINAKEVDTIYFGGGTPSYINEYLIGKVLDKIKERFSLSSDVEITLELNPGTVNKEKIEYYKGIGINRLSIGLQTTENRLLNIIGRIHTYEEFLDVYNLARECGKFFNKSDKFKSRTYFFVFINFRRGNCFRKRHIFRNVRTII